MGSTGDVSDRDAAVPHSEQFMVDKLNREGTIRPPFHFIFFLQTNIASLSKIKEGKTLFGKIKYGNNSARENYPCPRVEKKKGKNSVPSGFRLRKKDIKLKALFFFGR